MHTEIHRKLLAASLALLLCGFATASLAAVPSPATDMGAAPASQPIHVTLMLKLRHRAALEQFVQQTATQGSPNFQKFLTTSQFASEYGATDAQIAKVAAFLQQQGLSGQVLANHMAIETSGTVGQFAKMFQTSIHDYVSPKSGRHYRRPVGPLVLPSAIVDSVAFASGLSTQPHYQSHRLLPVAQPAGGQTLTRRPALSTLARSASGNPTATGQPGDYTVGDVANLYNINPLYKRGITGKGSTVGIVTLSDFYPSDARTYWKAIGLATKPNRITQVHVDGGGAIDGGSGETALDVEQSGGIAPDANIIVYDAPLAGNGFTDAFLQAVSDNKADSISTSWGGPEIFNFAALNVSTADDTDTRDAGDLRAFDQIFLEAAAQGQSLFAATGDAGAFDSSDNPPFVGTTAADYNTPLTVDSPASDPYITAAGGTTVPYSFSVATILGRGTGPVASITRESAWGWDYLQSYLDANAPTPGGWRAKLFSAGGGGGVSVYWHRPWYQWFTRGIESSQRKQSLVYNDPSAGPTTLLKLPARFPGRNLPDISLNADPQTGYVVVSTTDGGLISEGGTSFVAPQLNGVSALLTQSLGHRVGFWNPHVYLLQAIFGTGKYSAFSDIRAGDNWYYHGEPGFDQGSGVGTLNVANFDLFLRTGF
ncbi:MAG: S53 family serine peptidase [Rhodanobacter sp.]